MAPSNFDDEFIFDVLLGESDRSDLVEEAMNRPLQAERREPVEVPPWPTYTAEQLEILRDRTERRLDRVAGALIDQYLDGWFVRRAARVVWAAANPTSSKR